jgi:hypothetical protein
MHQRTTTKKKARWVVLPIAFVAINDDDAGKQDLLTGLVEEKLQYEASFHEEDEEWSHLGGGGGAGQKAF